MRSTKKVLLLKIVILICALINISTSSSNDEEKLNDETTYPQILANLGQDKTNDYIPEYVINDLTAGSKIAELNQYVPAKGTDRLLKAIATLYSKLLDRELNFDKNVLVSNGGSGALMATFHALTKPGDEWIIIDPFWPKYVKMIKLIGGVPRFVNLKLIDPTKKVDGKNWILDRNELENAFNNKTKGIVLNNPHNPIGKVFDLEDLQFIANLSEKYDTYVIADEVFEFTVYGPYKFFNFVTLPGMFNRTITIGSASKSLLLSGWRLGWAYGPEHLINLITEVHSIMFICAPAVTQLALAHALELETLNLGTTVSFFYNNTQNLLAKRNIMIKAFEDAGMTPYLPDSGDCMVVKLPKLKNFSFDFTLYKNQSDWLTNATGVLGLPMTDFYGDVHAELGKDSMRFCFQKKFETINFVAENLQLLRKHLP